MTSEVTPNTPRSIQRFAWGVVWQVGLLLLGIIGGSFALGVLMDRILGTRATFLVIALLLSAPLSTVAVYIYGRRKMGKMAGGKLEEGAHSD